MTLRTEGGDSGDTRHSSLSPLTHVLDLVGEVAARHEITALADLLRTARAALAQDEIAIAVLGRFKAGKSSFLNHFVGRGILPVGVVPVTAAITELRYGPRELARARFQNGGELEIPLDRIGDYISEKENPENVRQVALITVELPELRRLRGLMLVDTPGLESALAHNTEASLNWLPKVGLALLAVSVDPPLTQRDIDLLKSIYQYTHSVAVLLTKADLVSGGELAEVISFVDAQLAQAFSAPPPVFPYSTMPGFGQFREALEQTLIAGTLGRFAGERERICARKIDTLLRECGDFLALSLKSAESIEGQRQELSLVVGEKALVEEVKSEIRLVVRHAAAGTRSTAAGRLEAHQSELEHALSRRLEREFRKWSGSLGAMLASFEQWLAAALCEELTAVSVHERTLLVAPLHQVRKQAFRALQQFRDRLSERTERSFGVPLRTTEPEIDVVEPGTPDIRVGRVFDRNWELLSPVLPLWAIRGVVQRHFARTVPYAIYQNLSRLATQWEESINDALGRVEQEAGRRLDELMGTVKRLLESGGPERAPQLRSDLDRIRAARESLDRGPE
ncbi:MAG: dynamin family protein [Acidobacteriia bacterium]|nr:dynamin family protein [Terriglobia bacterium]